MISQPIIESLPTSEKPGLKNSDSMFYNLNNFSDSSQPVWKLKTTNCTELSTIDRNKNESKEVSISSKASIEQKPLPKYSNGDHLELEQRAARTSDRPWRRQLHYSSSQQVLIMKTPSHQENFY